MNRWLVFGRRAYGWMLRCYPAAFREVFESEMQGVFAEAAEEAAGKSVFALLRRYLREVRDWPGGVFKAHFEDWIERFRMSMEIGDRVWRMEEKGQAWLAALPPLVLGVGIGLRSLIAWRPWYELPAWQLYLGAAVWLAAVLVLLVGGVWALVRRLPAWGFSWVGAGLMILAVAVQVVDNELVEVGIELANVPLLDLLVPIVFFLSGLGLLAVGAWRGWQLAGLASIGFSASFGLSVLATVASAPFNRSDLNLLAFLSGAAMAAMTYIYCRRGELARILVLAGVAAMNIGSVVLANWVWASHLSPGGAGPLVPLLVLAVGVLAAGPVVGVLGIPIKRRLAK